MKRAIAKREVRKRHRECWNKFVNELETDITRPNPKTYKLLKHLNKERQENVSWNIIDKNV